jgi:archaeal flagellar protein FlaJ
MILFTVMIFFFISVIVAVLAFFINPGIYPPFFSLVPSNGLSFSRLFKVLMIPIFTPIIVFLALYLYPMTEQSSITKKIDQELPFAVIHMSAISGSGIEPTQIFKIIGLSKEYPALRKEIRKVLNQINLYGHDLVTSLRNVAATTPSLKLAELFSGVSTTITSGGDLSTFFEKRAESLLIAYRLEREKYTRLAETFMDVYISLVIAAPMILMTILVLISVSNLNTSISPLLMTILIIFIIGVLNAIFLGFLHLKQPNY